MDIETICLKAMTKEKSDRYRSADELRDDIRRFKAGEAISASQPGAGRLLLRWLRRHGQLVAVLFLALSGLIGWAGYDAYQGRRERLEAERARHQRIVERLARAEDLLAYPYPEDTDLEEAAGLYRGVLDLEPEEDDGKAASGGLERIEAIRKERRIRFFLDRGRRYIDGRNYEAAADMFTIVLEEYDSENEEARGGLRSAQGTGTLAITSDPVGAEVYLGRGPENFPEPPHDTVEGLGERLGLTPLEYDSMPMGLHRVTLVKPGYGRQSLPVAAGRGESVKLDGVVLIRADAVGGEEAAANLILIAGSLVEMDDGTEENVTDFCIDRYEHPNRLGVTPFRGGGQEDWGWPAALRLAESKDKNLPTRAQWVLAAGGPEGLDYPYGREFDATRAAVARAQEEGPQPCGTAIGDRSPFGVYDMSGNVSEWIQPVYDPWEEEEVFYASGGNWTSSLPYQSASTALKLYTESDGAREVGLRCVSNIDPGRLTPKKPARVIRSGREIKFDEVYLEKCPPDMIEIRPRPGTAAHKLVPYAFCIDRYEYPNKPGEKPLTNISWEEADRLARRNGRRLMTRDEWRVASGGPDLLPYPFGEEYAADRLCVDFKGDEEQKPDACDSWPDSHSPWGKDLLNLNGNVWEWVWDWHSPEQGLRGIVGGCWISGRDEARNDYWQGRSPTHKADVVGFRCAARLRE